MNEEVLDFSHRGLTPSEVTNLYKSLDQSSSSSAHLPLTVRLGFNNLGDDGAKLVGMYLKIDRRIVSLDLSFNNIGDHGIFYISSSLASHETMRVLHLSGNLLNSGGIISLAEALKRSKLTSLHLTGNCAESSGAIAIAEALQTNYYLQVLYLNGNKIGTLGATHLFRTLYVNHTLREIAISDNQIGDEGCLELSYALRAHRQLTHLNVSFNSISHVGIQYLCESLLGYTSMVKLQLDNNKIGALGGQLLARIIPTMRLEELDVGFNLIEADGLAALLQSLLPNQTLKTLSLSGNLMTVEVSLVMANILKNDSVLSHVHLDHVSIGPVGERNIAVGIATNVSSRLINLTGFHLGQVLTQLGSPPNLASMSNEKSLRYLHKMWSMHQDNSTMRASVASSSNAADADYTVYSASSNEQSTPQASPHRPSNSGPAPPSDSPYLGNSQTITVNCVEPLENHTDLDSVDMADAQHEMAPIRLDTARDQEWAVQDASIEATKAEQATVEPSKAIAHTHGGSRLRVGLSVEIVSSLLDSIDFHDGSQPPSTHSSGKSNEDFPPSPLHPKETSTHSNISNSSSDSQRRNNSFACAQNLSQAMRAFDRVYQRDPLTVLHSESGSCSSDSHSLDGELDASPVELPTEAGAAETFIISIGIYLSLPSCPPFFE